MATYSRFSGSLKNNSHTAFTLIELSIVLVIVGLIVGGILVGTELVNSAATRAQIAQFEKYNQAVNTFHIKYGGIPGDLAEPAAVQFGFNVSGCTGGQGHRDGNGLIDGWNTPFLWDQPIGETGVFWQDLSNAQLIEGSFPNGAVVVNGCINDATPITATTAGSYFPAGKIGHGTFVYVYENTGSNWFGLSAITSATGWQSIYSKPSIPVTQAYNMDKKMDDGLPLSGKVIAAYLAGGADGDGEDSFGYSPSAASDSATTCYNTSNNSYSITYNGGNGTNCALSFQFQ